MAMKKARKGKRGCLTRAGKLKKGFRWAKRRKGFCISTKKKAAKRRKVGSKKKATARRRRSVPPMSAELRAAILSVPSAEKRYKEWRGAYTPEELKSFGALRRRR